MKIVQKKTLVTTTTTSATTTTTSENQKLAEDCYEEKAVATRKTNMYFNPI